jgi:uncharacterized membrane protein YdjX (TVP38/TMEM64 family)
MRTRYAAVTAGIVGVLLTAYLLVEALRVPVVGDPQASLDGGGVHGAAVGVGLLFADALVPIAGSVVMVSLGALYGAPLGVALSLLGRTGMAAIGFGLGRRARDPIERLVPAGELMRAEALLDRHGAVAVAATRPVPLLSETMLVLAGASAMSWNRAMLAALIGSVPEVVAYSLAGAVAAGFENAGLIWASFLMVVAAFWLSERRLRRGAARPDPRVVR